MPSSIERSKYIILAKSMDKLSFGRQSERRRDRLNIEANNKEIVCEEGEVEGTGSGSYPLADFGISDFKPSVILPNMQPSSVPVS
jgi:hypothetical protein